MPNDISVHKFKGMNRDLDVSVANPEYAFENMNIRIEAINGNTSLSVTNEKGNKKLIIYDETGTNPVNIEGDTIGYSIIDENLILFTTEDAGDGPTYGYQNKFMLNSCTFSGITNNKIRIYVQISEKDYGDKSIVDKLSAQISFSTIYYNGVQKNLTFQLQEWTSGVRGITLGSVYYDFNIDNVYTHILFHGFKLLYKGIAVYESNSYTLVSASDTNKNLSEVLVPLFFPIYNSSDGIEHFNNWDILTNTNTGYYVYGLGGDVISSGNVYTIPEGDVAIYNHFNYLMRTWNQLNSLELPAERPDGTENNLVVGIAGFILAEEEPTIMLNLFQSEITGYEGEGKTLSVQVTPSNAPQAYAFDTPEYNNNYISFTRRYNSDFWITLDHATPPGGTLFTIKHLAADPVSATIYVKQFIIHYAIVSNGVPVTPENPPTSLGFAASGVNTNDWKVYVWSTNTFIVDMPNWIISSPGTTIFYKSSYPNMETEPVVLTFSATKNEQPLIREGSIKFKAEGGTGGQEAILYARQEASTTLGVVFSVTYSVPQSGMGVSAELHFTNSTVDPVPITNLKVYFVQDEQIKDLVILHSDPGDILWIYGGVGGPQELIKPIDNMATGIYIWEPFPSQPYIAIEFTINETTYGGVNVEEYKTYLYQN